MKKFMICIVVGLLFCAVNSAQADLTLESSSGSWTNEVGGPDININLVNTDLSIAPEVPYGNNSRDEIRWGVGVATEGQPLPPRQSGLGFTGVAAPAVPIILETPFEIGRLAHFNYTIAVPSSAVTHVDLGIAISISDDGGITTQDETFSFQLQVNETPNNDPITSPEADDIISFPTAFSTQSITFGEQRYALQLLGFGDSAESLTSAYSSPEGGTNRIELWGQLTPVPLPGAFLLGVLGLSAAGIKMRKYA